MNSDMLLVFAILGITIVVFISDKLRVDIVALLSLLALFAMLQEDEGFRNETRRIRETIDSLYAEPDDGGSGVEVVAKPSAPPALR